MKNKNIYIRLILGFLILVFVFLLFSYLYNRIKEPCQKSVKAMLKRDIDIDYPVNLSFKKIVWDWDFTMPIRPAYTIPGGCQVIDSQEDNMESKAIKRP